MISVRAIDSLSELDSLRGAWTELTTSSKTHSVFQTHEWLSTWWKHFGSRNRLFVLVLGRGREIVGIIPWYVGPTKKGFGMFRKVSFLGTELSDRLDFLLPDDPEGGVEHALLYLLKQTVPWDMLDLREMPEDSPGVEAVLAAAKQLGLGYEISVDSECPYLPIESDWKTFFATRFGRETRRQIRRKARRLEAETRPTFTIHETIPEGSRLLERLAAMPQDEEYRGTKRRSIFSDESRRAFFAEIAVRFSLRRWLHLGVLELDGEPAAYRFSFQYADKYLDYFTGFHRKYAGLSAGSVLLAHVMEDCYRRGLREVDFLRGTEPWKAVWTDRRRRNMRIRVFRPGPRGAALRLLLRSKGWLDHRRLPGAGNSNP